MSEERITLTDNVMTATMKLADGNPGAVSAIMALMQAVPTVDPQNAMGGLGAMLSLDSFGIYGTDIYVLWSDICGKDTVAFIAVLRAVQLGFIPRETVKDASSRQDYSGRAMIDTNDLYAQVKAKLEDFDVANQYAPRAEEEN